METRERPSWVKRCWEVFQRERPLGCSHLILLPPQGEHASTFITEKAWRSSVCSLQQSGNVGRPRPNGHHSIFAAASIRPLPTAPQIDRRSGADPFSSLPVRNSDGRRDRKEGECTTNESHPLIRSKRWLASFSLLDLDLTCATFPLSFSLWQRPNAFSIGFDCIRIFGVLLRCGCLGGRGGTGRPLEEEEMLWARRRFWCP